MLRPITRTIANIIIAKNPTPSFAHRSIHHPITARTMMATDPAAARPPAPLWEWLVVVPDKPGTRAKRLEVRPCVASPILGPSSPNRALLLADLSLTDGRWDPVRICRI
jgi:hypothetical protein